MTKEQEIYRNMRKPKRIFKSHGKWMIKYSSLYVSIKEAGYSDDKVVWKIMDGMKNKGYIRNSRDVNGNPKNNYIIEKWVN